MWEYKIGFSLGEAKEILGTTVTEQELHAMLLRHGFSFTFMTPTESVHELIPKLLGKTYKNPSSMQTDAPHAFSCSSLISYLSTRAGLPWMPSITADKYIYLKEVEPTHLEFGDLIFSNSGEGKIHYASIEWRHGTIIPEGVDHVGMYVDNESVLHASRTTGCVKIEKITDSISFHHIVGYRRVADFTENRFCVTIPEEFPELRSSTALLTHLKHGDHGEYVKHIIPVSYLSQLYDLTDPYWTNRACGGICLVMAARAFGADTEDDLASYFYKAEKNGFFTKSNGWLHQGLVEMAKAMNLESYRSEGGISDDLALLINDGALVVLSVTKTLFGVKRAHLVLCTGVALSDNGEVRGAYIYDPELLYPPKQPRFVSVDFLSADWSGKYVVIKKKI